MYGPDAYYLFGRSVPDGVQKLEVLSNFDTSGLTVRWMNRVGDIHEMELDDIDTVLIAMKLTC